MADIPVTYYKAVVRSQKFNPVNPPSLEEPPPVLNPPGSGSEADFVTYENASRDVNLGSKNLLANSLTLDPTPATIPTAQGSLYFDEDEQTIAAILNGTTQKIGEDSFFQVKNQTGVTIPKGTAVRFDGVVGASGRIKVVPFLADGTYPSMYFVGILNEELLDGGDGKAYNGGKVRGIDTSAFPIGTILYCSTTVAGGFQSTAPIAPNNIISVAAVIAQSATVGALLIRPQIGSNINTDEGVKIVGVADKNILQYQVGTGLWENKSLSGAGIVGGSGTLNYVPKWTPDGVTLGNSQIFDNGTNVGIGTVLPSEQLEITKNFRLPTTIGSTVGVIMSGSDRFIHNYGTSNTFVGVGSGNFAASGGYSVGIGVGSLAALTSGNFNTGIGRLSLAAVTTGERNVAIGSNALIGLSTGSKNVAIGTAALSGISTSSSMVAIGDATLSNAVSPATEDTAVGSGALASMTTGQYNTALGSVALRGVTTGIFNTGIGRAAGYAATGDGGTFIGLNSGINVTSGNYNTIIGSISGGGITTGGNNTIIGANVSGLAPTLSNNIILADGAGNIRINTISDGKTGFLTTAPTETIDVNGTARIRTIANLGSSATNVMVPSATGVQSLRTITELAGDMSAVQYISQTLTSAQKIQARVNIGSTSATPQIIATAGAINDLAVTSNHLVFTGASVSLSGIVAGLDGEELTLLNISGTSLTILSESALSSISNRFNSSVIIPNLSILRIKYRTTSNRWFLENVGINDGRYVSKINNDDKTGYLRFLNASSSPIVRITPNGTEFAYVFETLQIDGTVTFALNRQGQVVQNASSTGSGSTPVSLSQGSVLYFRCRNSLADSGETNLISAEFSNRAVFLRGAISIQRSLNSDGLIKRDEKYLNTSENVVTAGAINDQAITAGIFNQRFTLATSITGHANGENGRELTINNANTVSCDLVYESASSTAANRYYFATLANLTIPTRGIVTLVYNSTISRWELKNKNF